MRISAERNLLAKSGLQYWVHAMWMKCVRHRNLADGRGRKVNHDTAISSVKHRWHNLTKPRAVEEHILLCQQVASWRGEVGAHSVEKERGREEREGGREGVRERERGEREGGCGVVSLTCDEVLNGCYEGLSIPGSHQVGFGLEIKWWSHYNTTDNNVAHTVQTQGSQERWAEFVKIYKITGYRAKGFTHPHECECLGLRLLCLGEVKVHLITIKVSIVRSTHALVEPEGPTWHHFSLKCGIWSVRGLKSRAEPL